MSDGSIMASGPETVLMAVTMNPGFPGWLPICHEYSRFSGLPARPSEVQTATGTSGSPNVGRQQFEARPSSPTVHNCLGVLGFLRGRKGWRLTRAGLAGGDLGGANRCNNFTCVAVTKAADCRRIPFGRKLLHRTGLS